MNLFSRFLHHLKQKVKNRARVEGSIVEAYIVEEVSTFCSLYFESDVETRLTRPPRNDDGGDIYCSMRLSIFSHPGRPLGSQRDGRSFINDDERNAAHKYILLNCDEIIPFVGCVRMFNYF